MLLALRVKNFKSIRAATVRFGALTCLIGRNGVGKSNLFDAIHFLSVLADHDIHEATSAVRSSGGDAPSPLELIYGRDPRLQVELGADMIVPNEVRDDFNQVVKPSTTLLSYSLCLRYDGESDRLLVESESLEHSRLGDFREFTRFASSSDFRESVAIGSRRGGPLISTDQGRGAIMLHGDGGSRGRPAPVGRSPLTVVGGTNTFDYPTVLAAKREMSSWRLLYLEPSAMRSPDQRSSDRHVSSSGGRLASTFASLMAEAPNTKTEVVRRLRQLNSDVEDLDVYNDRAREQLVLRARIPGVDKWLYGRSLSDGMLRYIALSLMLVDVHDRVVLCLEEPENGIHPSRIPALVELLYDYAVDLDFPVGPDNPPRQVILNTHSPEVARRLKFEDILFAERATQADGSAATSVFRPVADTWRDIADEEDSSLPKDRRAVADFIGGAPLGDEPAQMKLDFGSAI